MGFTASTRGENASAAEMLSLRFVCFGLTLAFALDEPFNVLSGTATYAAVLVVFVGTSSP